ncbi:MAG TPA: alkaline phosphatase family protein [Burkholderiaceae bacterium]|nr:alkaline phosphatase family protein [Burkholderiaceae bacterium]
MAASAGEIKNIFVLLLENRSFDHMLGFSGITGTQAGTNPPVATSLEGLTKSEHNGYLGARYVVGQPFHEPVAVDPAHEFLDVLEQLCGTQAIYERGQPYPKINNSGFVSDYARSHTKEEGGAVGNFGQIMDGFAADQLPVLNTLAKSFAVCDGWHASLPGPTFPNRLFAMGASSNGLDHSPASLELLTWEGLDGFSYVNGSIFDALSTKFGSEAWRIYAGNQFPLVCALKGISTFDVHSVDDLAADLKGGAYPYRLTWIEPDYGDMVSGTFRGGTSQHPMDNAAGGENLIKRVYEAIKESPLWESSLLIISWDEHGGFYDHIPPGKAVAPGDTKPGSTYNQYGFDFTQLGVRVPAVVISPRIPAGTIDHRAYDHSSIPKTIEKIFELPSLTKRDAAANSVDTLLTLPEPRKDAPDMLPLTNTRGDGEDRPIPLPGNGSAERGNLPLFLHIAMRHEFAVSDSRKRAAIVHRAQSIKTQAQAAQYLSEIDHRVTMAKRRAAAVKTGH